MTAKEIMAHVPAPNSQAITSICLSTRGRETVSESIERSVKVWVENIRNGKISLNNGIWTELPFYGTTHGWFELTEEGYNRAKIEMSHMRHEDARRNDSWRTPRYKSVYRIAKVYNRYGFIPTLAQVKKALENLD